MHLQLYQHARSKRNSGRGARWQSSVHEKETPGVAGVTDDGTRELIKKGKCDNERRTRTKRTWAEHQWSRISDGESGLGRPSWRARAGPAKSSTLLYRPREAGERGRGLQRKGPGLGPRDGEQGKARSESAGVVERRRCLMGQASAAAAAGTVSRVCSLWPYSQHFSRKDVVSQRAAVYWHQ